MIGVLDVRTHTDGVVKVAQFRTERQLNVAVLSLAGGIQAMQILIAVFLDDSDVAVFCVGGRSNEVQLMRTVFKVLGVDGLHIFCHCKAEHRHQAKNQCQEFLHGDTFLSEM